MIKGIIFDFDGTISDSFQSTIESYNSAAGTLRAKQLKEEDYEIVKNNPLLSLVKIFNISKWKIPFIAVLARRAFKNKVKSLETFLGIRELLTILQKDFEIFIASSNSKHNLETFLSLNLDLKAAIKKVYGDRNPFNKHNLIKKLLKENNLKEDEVLYVGDELRDIEACKKIGIKIISVTWGFSSREILIENNEPGMSVDNPTDLLKLVRRLKIASENTDNDKELLISNE